MWLNYHHLQYFWSVAREGNLTAAAARMRVSPSTVSTQIKQLEAQLGHALFRRQGRRLQLTETGQTAFRYAEEIFGLGNELLEVLADDRAGRTAVNVGFSMVVPKQVAAALLAPIWGLDEPVRLRCHEGRTQDLLPLLVSHRLDVVITDAPVGPESHLRTFTTQVGESGVLFVAEPERANRLRPGFPESLSGEPMLLPLPSSSVRPALDHWLDRNGVRPIVLGEFDDSAMMKSVGRGRGVIPIPSMVQAEVEEQLGLVSIGVADGVTERFFAISVERQARHPAVAVLMTPAGSA